MVAVPSSTTRTAPRPVARSTEAPAKKPVITAPRTTAGTRTTGATGTTSDTGDAGAAVRVRSLATDGTNTTAVQARRPDERVRSNARLLMANDQGAALQRMTAERLLDKKAKDRGNAPSLDQVRAGTHVLMQGHEGPAVKAAQGQLNAIGTDPAVVEDSVYGPQTEAAVRAFQQENGLPVDGRIGKTTLEAMESPTAEQIARDDEFPLLDCLTQNDVKARLEAAKDDPAARKNIAALVRSDGFEAASPADRKALLEAQGKDTKDPGFTRDLVGLARDPAFRALPEGTRGTVIGELGRHPTDPAARGTIRELATSPGFAGMPADEQEKLTRLVGGTNTQLSAPARAQLDALLGSDAYQKATPAEQTAQLQTFLEEQPGLIGVTNGYGTDFDAQRQPYEMTGPTDVDDHEFPSGKADALRYDVVIDGQTIPVYLPKDPDAAEGGLHSAEEVAKGLAALPAANRALIEEVSVDPHRNPADEYWAEKYGDPNFRSYMTAGAEGKVTIYPSGHEGTASQSVLDSSLIHETGHVLSGREYGGDDDARWDRWEAAMESDGVDASGYARNSKGEDFAETLTLYQTVRGTPQEAELRALMPERFALIDELLGVEPPSSGGGGGGGGGRSHFR